MKDWDHRAKFFGIAMEPVTKNALCLNNALISYINQHAIVFILQAFITGKSATFCLKKARCKVWKNVISSWRCNKSLSLSASLEFNQLPKASELTKWDLLCPFHCIALEAICLEGSKSYHVFCCTRGLIKWIKKLTPVTDPKTQWGRGGRNLSGRQ